MDRKMTFCCLEGDATARKLLVLLVDSIEADRLECEIANQEHAVEI